MDKFNLTRLEAADYIGVSAKTLANWASSGSVKIPFYKIGKKRVIYKKIDLDGYLESVKKVQS